MSTVFIGGSRQISRLSAQANDRLDNIVSSHFKAIVGDANGADKAVQKYFHDALYKNVVVFCSGERCRNNLGGWKTHNIKASKNLKGFEFYAAKDREMAQEADFGLMIWDGKSVGTALNVLRLIRAGKKAVLLDTPNKKTINFKTSADWDKFISQCSRDLVDDLRNRATTEEWTPHQKPLQPSFLDTPEVTGPGQSHPVMLDDALAAEINAALATGNPASVVDTLGNIARAQGMTQLAKESGLARESLYRSLSANGNPEFATVFKVIASMGLRLVVDKIT